MPRFEYRIDGKRLLVPIAILLSASAANPTAIERIEGLVDTGASVTGIRQDIAERLSLSPKGKRRVQTVSSDTLRTEYLFRVGIYEHPDQISTMPHLFDGDVLGIELTPNFTFEALIGMDIIAKVDLRLERGEMATLIL